MYNIIEKNCTKGEREIREGMGVKGGPKKLEALSGLSWVNPALILTYTLILI